MKARGLSARPNFAVSNPAPLEIVGSCSSPISRPRNRRQPECRSQPRLWVHLQSMGKSSFHSLTGRLLLEQLKSSSLFSLSATSSGYSGLTFLRSKELLETGSGGMPLPTIWTKATSSETTPKIREPPLVSRSRDPSTRPCSTSARVPQTLGPL